MVTGEVAEAAAQELVGAALAGLPLLRCEVHAHGELVRAVVTVSVTDACPGCGVLLCADPLEWVCPKCGAERHSITSEVTAPTPAELLTLLVAGLVKAMVRDAVMAVATQVARGAAQHERLTRRVLNAHGIDREVALAQVQELSTWTDREVRGEEVSTRVKTVLLPWFDLPRIEIATTVTTGMIAVRDALGPCARSSETGR